MFCWTELRKQGAVFEESEAECPQGHGREARVRRANEIFIVPVGFLGIEAYSLDAGEVAGWEIDQKADAKVIQP